MKKLYLTLIALLTITTCTYAQDQHKGFIGVSVGPSVPIGDLASKDVDNNAAGWAKTGAFVDISAGLKLGGSNFGVTAALRGQSNPTDAQAYANEYVKNYPNIDWTVKSSNWSIGGFMIGAFGSLPISKNSSLDLKGMFGFLNSTSPEIKVTGSKFGLSASGTRDKATATSLAYLVGAGFKFGIGSRLYVLTGVDYLGSKPEFKDVETHDSFGRDTKDTYSQTISSINLNLGIGIRL